MAKGLTNVQEPKRKNQSLITPKIDNKHPSLGMSMVKLTGAYSLDEFIKVDKSSPERNIRIELLDLQKSLRRYDNILDFMKDHRSKHGQISSRDNEVLKAELKRIRLKFDKEFNDPIKHIHVKPKGAGSFVLFGFVNGYVFEVLLLDPNHEIAGS